MSAAVASPRHAGSAAGIALAALHVPEGPLQFQGLLPYPPVAVSSSSAQAAAIAASGGGARSAGGRAANNPPSSLDDWGLSLEQQVTAVERFRALLESRGQWSREHHDYYGLLRFLRARNYDLDKAGRMWQDSLEWRAQLGADGMLGPLGGGGGAGGADGGGTGGGTGGGSGAGTGGGGTEGGFVFHEREQFLMAYPQGYHKTDKMGRPVYIQLLGRIDIAALRAVTTEDRMVKFHIQEYERCAKVIFPVCSWLAPGGPRHIDQTFGIMDVKGVGLSHLSGEVKRLLSVLTKYDQDNYPEMLGRIVIINAPMVFKAVWGLVKPYLNPRTISKIAICGADYLPELLTYVDAGSLPEWLGGRSKGTLLDDAGPWSDPAVLRRIERDSASACASGKLSACALAQLRRALRLAGLPPLGESIPAAPLVPHMGGAPAPVAVISPSGGGGGHGHGHHHHHHHHHASPRTNGAASPTAAAAAAGVAAVTAAAATGAAVVRLSSFEEQQAQTTPPPQQHHAAPPALSLGGGAGAGAVGGAGLFGGGGGGGGGGGPGSEATEGGYATPRSDLSLFSPSPSMSSAGGASMGLGAQSLDVALLRLQSGGGGGAGGDTATSALRAAEASSPRSTAEAAAPTPSPSPLAPAARGFAAPPGASAARTRGLLERLAVLERQYGGQVQRLKGYLPALPPATAALLSAEAAAAVAAAASGATGGGGADGPAAVPAATTMQRRVEALEASMDLLLRAQELTWDEQQQQQQQLQQRRQGGGCFAPPAADGSVGAPSVGGPRRRSSGCVIS